MRPRGRYFINRMLALTETDGLFGNFEINREPFWPRISWLLAGSGVWHLVVVKSELLIFGTLAPTIREGPEAR